MKFSNPIRTRLFRLSATLAILAWSHAGAFGVELNVAYHTGSDLPVSTDGYTATGSAVHFTLDHAPATGAELMVVQNTGLGFIDGVFDNLAQGQTVTLNYSGVIYRFVANYYGGTGNDLVLVWKRSRLLAWGYNAHGQLGDDTTIQANYPVPVTATGVLAGKTIVSIAAGGEHSIALCSDGTVAAWGCNNFGQLGDNSTTDRHEPVAVNRASGVSALFGKTVVAVAAGQLHSLAACSDGTVAAWGCNERGQLGDDSVTSRSTPVSVNRTTALSGKVVVGLGAGDRSSVALCSDGTLASWGTNTDGQLGDNSTVQRVVPAEVIRTSGISALFGKTAIRVAGGGSHTLALCSDGTVVAWGQGRDGQLGNGGTGIQLAPVAVNTTTALSGKTVTSVSAGHLHSLALCSDGTLVAWGTNHDGQLGDGTTSSRPLPAAVLRAPGLTDKIVSVLVAGSGQNVALCSDGTLAAWGSNRMGMLGDDTTTNRHTPVQVILNPAIAGGTATDLPPPVPVIRDRPAARERFALLYRGSTNVHTLASLALPPAPEIHLTGNGVNILDGDRTPSPADHTDFGPAIAGGGTVVRTFTIQNTGDVALNLTATPKVSVSGPDAADFTVAVPPASPLASGGGSTTFEVTFHPTAPGIRRATLSIASDDGNAHFYDFAISGTAAASSGNDGGAASAPVKTRIAP